MGTKETKEAVLVTGVIGEDVHNIGISILEYALRNAGFKVVPLGIFASQEDFINAAIETKAAAILISSLSGHARALVSGLREKCIETNIGDILLYLGGQLFIGQASWDEIEKTFKEMGFNRVYPPLTLPGRIIADLGVDLGLKTK